MADQPPDLEKLLAESTRVALRRGSLWLDQRCTEEISRADWSWPRSPSPRDLVDTGRPWTKRPLEELPAFMDRVHQDELRRLGR